MASQLENVLLPFRPHRPGVGLNHYRVARGPTVSYSGGIRLLAI
ncbi:uncharacterized protein ANIA_11266 [Aspergillus nidulans FGSC A4]|uniref:Uncharacterized protein n=1 Tax=Emericella nidulans (strain FGSC A4 / ATCC 38163 / CBS 112.46 / NRRL 194 / M139) TaxID=227321 RepID=C8VU93_EMENI|nr:hypothetical protein [Aspergillus nidulans FGSC A4]CBF89767.1 TPA: hypothetical protein ANIA_11266 [Aspergillus nidulans FGSC A4]